MFTAVTTTGIFCNNRCPAQPPRKENRLKLESVRDCLGVGCRPCKRCKPMHVAGGPDWLQALFNLVEDSVSKQELIDSPHLRTLGLSKQQLGRWFANHHQMTFDAYCRTRRLAAELGTRYCDQRSENSVGRKALFQALFERKAPA